MNTRIDSHKLIFHPERVADWKNGRQVLPINIEISPMGACNHRCVFCAADYLGYKPLTLDKKTLMDNIRDIAGSKGLKSVLMAGSGEPCLHPELSSMIREFKELDVDVALSTNGVLFTPELIQSCLKDISWIRFSISGGTEQTYQMIHRGRPGDLQRVFDNISYAANFKKEHHLHTVLNVQIVMTPDNYTEVVLLAKTVKELGADTIIVKPVGGNGAIENDVYTKVDRDFYNSHESIKREVEEVSDEHFQVVFRVNKVNRLFSERDYDECYASPFHMLIAANGDVYPCCQLNGIKEYCFGNIYEETLSDIIADKAGRRQEVLDYLKETKLARCITGCKLDPMNRYLNELVHPNEHVNFI